MRADAGFPGSYEQGDVTFLLRRLALAPVPLQEREQSIQSGSAHYSEMIGPEDAPTRARLRLFRESMAANGQRLGQDLVTLAAMLAESARGGELTIVSIARAGTPIGVVLTRLLRAVHGADRVRHYSISVIRDRGIDPRRRWLGWRIATAPRPIRFVDGWTGKGTIATELANSLRQLSGPHRRRAVGAAGYQRFRRPRGERGGLPAPDRLCWEETISGLVACTTPAAHGISDPPKFHSCVELSPSPPVRPLALVCGIRWEALCQQCTPPCDRPAPPAGCRGQFHPLTALHRRADAANLASPIAIA